MSFLLDTNVVSELRKPERVCAISVREWARAHDPESLYLSVLTVQELETGIGRIERRDAAQGRALRLWLEEHLLRQFEHRILSIDLPIARRAAQWHVPHPRPWVDAMIGATAFLHGLTVVTRNIRDFEPLGVPTINPWGRPAR